MKIVLLKDIKDLGRLGEVLEVKRGYARNFLIPRKLARLADERSLQETQKHREQIKNNRAKTQEQARKLATRLSNQTFIIAARSDGKGHLYAGLKETAVLAKIRESEPELPGTARLLDYLPAKQLGNYPVKVRLESDINAVEINLQVIRA